MSSNIQGKVIVIVAPSGAGKTTIAKRLLKDFSEIKFSISATTRPPRDRETDGQDYFFLSEEEFDRKVKENQFLEWEYYNGNKYGTLRSEVDKMMESGYFPLLDIEVKGAKNIKKLYGSDAVSIFIKPPSIDELERRLSRRGTESNKVVTSRLKQAKEEMKQADYFDYVIVNDDFETAYSKVKAIIEPFITD